MEDAIITENREFTDFEMSADFYIVNLTAGFVLRAQDDQNYYTVQYDLRAGNPDCVGFGIFSDDERIRKQWPKEKILVGRAYNHLVKATVYPEGHERWYRMKVVVKGFKFSVYLGSNENDLQLSAEWEDPFKTFRKGAIGFWQDTGSGESAKYDNLIVTSID